jgi:energy-coupling factor transporter ATP-binding protein EcfA2
MNLKSLYMGNFGPFRGKVFEFGPGLNLIFGPNEAGKTTLVDAIIISLLGHTQKKGGSLKSIPRYLKHLKNRYGSEISLRTVVNRDGRDLEFPAPQNFDDLCGVGWDELRAIFIAREGDLELAKGEPREFRIWWETLKGKLLGFQEEPRVVLKKIAAEADLTDNLGLTVIQKARRAEIESGLAWFTENEARIGALRGLEKDYQTLRLEEKRLAGEVDIAEKGVRKGKLLKAQEIHDQMKAAGERLRQDYGRFAEKDVKDWERLAQASDKEAAKVEWLREQKLKEEKKYQETVTQAAELAQRINALGEKSRSAAEREEELAQVALQEGKDSIALIPPWAPWAAWTIAVLALIIGVPADSLVLMIGGVLLVAAAVVLTYLQRKGESQATQFLRRREALLRWGRELDLEAETLPDLLLRLMDLRKERDELEGQRKTLQEQLPKLSKAIDDLVTQEKAKLGEIEKIRDQISRLREKVGIGDLDDLQKSVRGKTDLQSDVEKKYKGALRALLGPDEATWSRQLGELSALDRVPPVEDETLFKELNKELQDCRRDQQTKYEQLTNLKAELKANFDCQKPEEVVWKVADLRRVLKELEVLERAGDQVREIFDQLLQKSDGILDEIITGESVCRGFQQVTGNKYQAVAMEDLVLMVTDKDGQQWNFANLSTGTRDQLLTVLRLALAEKLLHEKGFFIFDDPLVSSDRTRLREQMEILGHLTREGWQILFLTAQDEVRQEAERLTDQGVDVLLLDL